MNVAHQLADDYKAAVDELNRHWPDEAGVCLGCGEPYPCPAEWLTQRAIVGIEARWRREAARLEAARG